MTSAELLRVLQEFYAETLALVDARQTNSRGVSEYSANNAYQQVLGRQDVHLRWVSDAIAALGGSVAPPAGFPEDVRGNQARGRPLIDSDVRGQQAFLDRWTPRVAAVTNARHRKMLELILGEMREHLRALQQAAEGRTDLLGRHPDGKILRGEVLAGRPKN